MKLLVKAIPGAQRTEVMEWLEENKVKIRLNAVPEKGKANDELIGYLSKKLSVPRSHITILKGATSREKTVGLPDMEWEVVREVLR